MITICGTQRARDSKTHGNAAMKEINNYLNVENNGVPAPKKASTKKKGSENGDSKVATARSRSSTKDKQPSANSNGSEKRRRKSVSAKKDENAPSKGIDKP